MVIDQRELWREYAQVYRLLRALSPYRDLLFELIDQSMLEPDSKVLDVGCGDGGLIWGLHAKGHTCPVTGLDSSPDMLQLAASEPYAGQTEFIQADLNQPIEGGPYQRFISNNVLYAVKQPAAALRNLGALAAPGALMVVSTPAQQPDARAILAESLKGLFGAVLEHERDRLTGLLARVAEINDRIIGEAVFHFPTQSELRGWYANSGWRIIDLHHTYAGQNWLVRAERR